MAWRTIHCTNVVQQESQNVFFLETKIVTVLKHCIWISHALIQRIVGLLNILYYFPTEKMKSCCWEKLRICARNCQVYLMEKLSFHTHSDSISILLHDSIIINTAHRLGGEEVTHFYCNNLSDLIFTQDLTWYQADRLTILSIKPKALS